MILDTCFFIDAERRPELINRTELQAATTPLCTTIITWGELAAGIANPSIEELARITLNLPILQIDERVTIAYGRLVRYLGREGRIIGQNDRWIAAMAVVYGMPILTRNVDEFKRVPGLVVATY